MRFYQRNLLAVLLAAGSAGLASGADYGLPAAIQDGNILHCFNWTMAEVKAELPNIAAAGYGSVQLSPLQRPDAKKGESWHALYRPYDLAFKSSGMGSEQDLKSLCDEAATYGIKVIVDVVANHVDKTAGYHDTWWDANGRVRWNGGIDYSNRYSVTHGQLGDYGDVNSEDAEVCARGKAYVQKLHDLGVKGIRWDAAKHIGLPSEGCNFWSSVTSVAGMWHYGEILDEPASGQGQLIKEYANYMSVTDNKYSDGAAKENGGIPYGYGGDWVVNQGVADTKVVYWGESHDTYSNNDGWSKYADQATIDRAYASFACRNGATALYLARPDATDFNSIKVGKGSKTAYKGKAITEVNKFRNAMVGKPDWCEAGGNTFCVTRQNGGAVIVMKGSGNVSVKNGGGYCPAGTYTDKVSGGKFTVTASTISGNVGSSGIAVIYNGGEDPGPDPDPDPDPDGEHYIYYDGTLSAPQVWAWNDSGNCTEAPAWGGDDMIQKNGKWYWELPAGKSLPTGVIIHEGDNKIGGGDLVYVDKATYHQDGSYTLEVPTPDKPVVTATPVSGTTFQDDITVTLTVSPAATIYYTTNGSAPSTSSRKYASALTFSETTTLRTLAVTAEGTKNEQSFTYTKSSTPGPQPTPGDNLVTDYYKVNPNGQVGERKTIDMAFNGQKATNAMSHWSQSDIIAQGVARDVCQAMKGVHERPIVDSYAIYAAYDNDNLYLGVQFVYTIWDIGGEGKQPGESKPYNMDGRLMWAFDLDPNKSFDGYINGTKAIWNDEGKPGAKFDNGVDAVWIGSTKPGVGTPGFFIPTPDGHASYDAAYCKSINGSYYGYADGIHPSITNIWGQNNFGFDPEVLKGNDGFADLRGEIAESAHTFYEWKLPLSVLGVTADYIQNNGIGVMYLDVYGASPVGGTPYDPSYFDNAKDSYSMDSSSSKEKEDEDIITYAPARVGKLVSQSGVENISTESVCVDAEPEYYNLQGVRVIEPAPGMVVIERRGNVVTKKVFR